MLSEILNLEGVASLSRKQQAQINGGQTCEFSTTSSSGASLTFLAGGFSEGSAGSSEANNDCVAIIQQQGGSCSYDCAYDGFGQ